MERPCGLYVQKKFQENLAALEDENPKLEPDILLDFYCKEVRSILEFGVACWNCGLTGKSSDQIERIQKICVNIILCDSEWEIPYFVGCTLLGLEPLSFRQTDVYSVCSKNLPGS